MEIHSPIAKEKALLTGVSLISFSVLALEITYTRILSVTLSYHYVFVVVSVALLGLGAGGMFAHFAGRKRTAPPKPGSLSLLAGLLSLSIPVTLILVSRFPYVDNVLPYALVISAPFLFAGAVLSQAFRMLASHSNRVYAADLIGAAAGSLAVVTLMDKMGAINTGLLVSLAAAAGAVIFAGVAGRRWRMALVNLAAIASLLPVSLAIPALSADPMVKSPVKELSAAMYDEPTYRADIVETRWTSFGRTDLVQYRNRPDVMGLYVDGTAGTFMYRFSGDIKDPGPEVESLKAFPAFLPLRFLPPAEKESALIIGPGGGRDVLVALMGGVREITAVEVNPDFVDIVKEHAAYDGGIYTSYPNVRVVVAEGRNFLKGHEGEFNIIMMSLPITKTSRSPEGFALTENYLFTRESIEDYLDHLASNGRLLVVAHEPVEVLKLFTLSMAALADRGIPNKTAIDHIYTASAHQNSLFVLSKSRINPEESYLEHEAVHRLLYHPEGSYFPYVKQSINPDHLKLDRFDECQMLSPVLTAIGDGRMSLGQLAEAAARQGLDFSVATDDRPFFYKQQNGVPPALSSGLWLASGALFAGIAATAVPWKRKARHGPSRASHQVSIGARPVVLFSMLGLGFMLVEISLIQRFTLFLGEPILSVTVLLFSLLAGAGLGGLVSGRFPSATLSRSIALASLVTALLVASYIFVMPAVFNRLLGGPLFLRAVASAALLAPLGFVMGLPFPLGMRLVKSLALEPRIPWLWGINGVASVVGSLGAIVAAITFGLTWASLLGAASYFLISLIFFAADTGFEPVFPPRGGGVPGR